MSETKRNFKEMLRNKFSSPIELYKAGREDMGEATWAQRISLGATAVGVTFHELTGAEALMGATATHVYQETAHNPVIAPIAAGTAMGMASLVMETALTFGVNGNLRHFRRTAEVRAQQLEAKETAAKSNDAETEAKTPTSTISKVVDNYNTVMAGAAFGTPGILLKDFHENPDKTSRERLKKGMKTAGILAVSNTVIGGVISGGAQTAEALGAEHVTDIFLRFAENPLTYVALIGGGRIAKSIVSHRQRRAARNVSSDVEAQAVSLSQTEVE